MLKVFDINVYVFLDLRANLSFVTLFVACKFGLSPEVILKPYSIYNPIGGSIVARKVY